MVIWKFALLPVDEITIEMPRNARILTVQSQNDNPCLWALVDPENELQERTFLIFGTGHPIEDIDDLEYVGTTQMAGGALIWHVFEKK